MIDSYLHYQMLTPTGVVLLCVNIEKCYGINDYILHAVLLSP